MIKHRDQRQFEEERVPEGPESMAVGRAGMTAGTGRREILC